MNLFWQTPLDLRQLTKGSSRLYTTSGVNVDLIFFIHIKLSKIQISFNDRQAGIDENLISSHVLLASQRNYLGVHFKMSKFPLTLSKLDGINFGSSDIAGGRPKTGSTSNTWSVKIWHDWQFPNFSIVLMLQKTLFVFGLDANFKSWSDFYVFLYCFSIVLSSDEGFANDRKFCLQ